MGAGPRAGTEPTNERQCKCCGGPPRFPAGRKPRHHAGAPRDCTAPEGYSAEERSRGVGSGAPRCRASAVSRGATGGRASQEHVAGACADIGSEPRSVWLNHSSVARSCPFVHLFLHSLCFNMFFLFPANSCMYRDVTAESPSCFSVNMKWPQHMTRVQF